ncbi:MAG: phosphatase PAP2 family protein [Prevotellaceae bacterium]|nr:phosphatase PAP2 family protein [Prevotellaceae bacterium]
MFGTVIPLLSILILYKLKVISSMGLEDRKDRFLPYFCTSISYFACALILFQLAIPTFVSELIIAVAVALLINSVVNIWWKISAHMTGMGALLGGILLVSYQFHFNPYNWILATVFACGMVAAARLYLNAHTPGQVVAGLLNGALCTLIIPGLNLGCRFGIW